MHGSVSSAPPSAAALGLQTRAAARASSTARQRHVPVLPTAAARAADTDVALAARSPSGLGTEAITIIEALIQTKLLRASDM